MGTSQSRDQRNSTSSTNGGGASSGGRLSFFSKSSHNHGHHTRPLKEHKRHGVVTVRINAINNNRRNSEGPPSQVITPKGAILFGSLSNPVAIQNGKSNFIFLLISLWFSLTLFFFYS
jgi:hypothetical protein